MNVQIALRCTRFPTYLISVRFLSGIDSEEICDRLTIRCTIQKL